MVEKAFLVEPRRKAVMLVRHPSIMVVIGVGALLLFIGKTVGAAQELPTGTIGLSGRAFVERPGVGGISYPVAATHDGRATPNPGQWLIDDVARERAKFELRQVSPMPPSVTNARDVAHVGAAVGSPSSDERRAQEVTSSIGTPTVGDGTLGTRRPQQALKQSNGAPPRPDPSPRLVASATKCAEAPVGLAPEGEHWYYRLDRETHRTCWYVRALKADRAGHSIVEGDLRSELASPKTAETSIAVDLEAATRADGASAGR